MSKVEELLAKYNPKGVDLFKLSEICYNHDSKRKPISKSNRIPGSIPYYGANGIQDYVAEYIFDGEYILVGEDGTVTTENGYPIVKWVNGKFWVNNHAHIFSENKNIALLKFIYHFLQTIYIKDLVRGLPPKLTKEALLSIKLKIPHIKVQEEIVKILDSFTNLIDALNEELSLRQKQFEYYREKLLTFDDSVKRIKLEDIGFFYGGLSGKTKNDFIEGNKKFVSYMNVFTNSTICLDINDKVKISDGETQNKIAYGDILFTGSSETPNECGMSSVVTTEIDEEIYLNSFCFGYRFNNLDGICPKFFSFLLRSTSMRNEISKTANGVTRFNVSKKLLAKVNVFIPSLKVQQSIVTKLDAFESLISSLKEEIALRQKQYEYYREKLLTFE